MIGTRIRERRMMNGLRQTELADRAGISASYLNLIEHNRRRIGGKTLLQIAEALNVEPTVLSEGAGATLIAALREAAAAPRGTVPELDRVEEFAGRFPGWAALLAELDRQRGDLERSVKTLTERLAHDPQLSDSLLEVISTVTSIRSTATILAETNELEPEWQNRFHRNINEDSQRLAEGAEALVRYLEAAPDTGMDVKSPQDELHAFLEAYEFHFPTLEGFGAEARIDELLDESPDIQSSSARSLARSFLQFYIKDAKALPITDMQRALEHHGPVPEKIASELGVGMAVVFRRLALLPPEMAGPVGLVICDGSGSVLFRKPALGFVLPRVGAGCTLWPVYQVLAQPGRPVRVSLKQQEVAVQSLALTEEVVPAGFETPALVRAHMLILPDSKESGAPAPREVGVTCQICVNGACVARREPSILSEGF